MTTYPQVCYIKYKELTLIPLVAVMMWTSAAVSIQTVPVQVQAIEEHEIPLASCIYDGHEYPMDAHIVNEEQTLNRIDFPNLPDNYEPQMVVQKGNTVTIEFKEDKPSKLNAYLIDYDADVTEAYPLKKINEDTFELNRTGIKTLEVVATLSNDMQVSYNLLVDVKDSA
jgi:hypothetical protein